MPLGTGLLGAILIILAIATPFLAVIEAKKMFVNVYQDRVRGAYKQVEGNKVQYVPYDLTFDRIESASAKKSKVFLQISGRTLESRAFNAAEVVQTISSHLSRPA